MCVKLLLMKDFMAENFSLTPLQVIFLVSSPAEACLSFLGKACSDSRGW